MTPNGASELDQHRLGWWLVAWQHQAIVWAGVDLVLKGIGCIRLGETDCHPASAKVFILYNVIANYPSCVPCLCLYVIKWTDIVQLQKPCVTYQNDKITN